MRISDILKKNRPAADEEKESLALRYAQLTDRLEQIRAGFDYAVDDSAIDALIYEENAVLCRLSALYKQAREEGVSLEIYESRMRR